MLAAWNPFQNRTKGAYANNQHQLSAEIKKNPRKTSFYRAIKLCAGVLLILDSEATPFTRSLGCNAILSERMWKETFANFNHQLCQRYDLQQGFPVIFSQVHDHFLHLNSTLTVKTHAGAFRGFQDFPSTAQFVCGKLMKVAHLVHVFLCFLVFEYVFSSLSSPAVFFCRKIGGFGVAWRIHRRGRAWLSCLEVGGFGWARFFLGDLSLFIFAEFFGRKYAKVGRDFC